MIKTGSPKCLWDHCLELEAYVRSCTSNDIYMTAGQVPEIFMTGNTTNISHIAEFGWYNWVMFHDNEPSYPDDKLILGHYLGPAIDTGLALMAKIFFKITISSSNRKIAIFYPRQSLIAKYNFISEFSIFIQTPLRE